MPRWTVRNGRRKSRVQRLKDRLHEEWKFYRVRARGLFLYLKDTTDDGTKSTKLCLVLICCIHIHNTWMGHPMYLQVQQFPKRPSLWRVRVRVEAHIQKGMRLRTSPQRNHTRTLKPTHILNLVQSVSIGRRQLWRHASACVHILCTRLGRLTRQSCDGP